MAPEAITNSKGRCDMTSRSAGTGWTGRITAAATVLAAFVTAHAMKKDKDDDRGPHNYTIGLFGDQPYNTLGRSQFPALLADINANHVEFSVFDGDLKAGGDGPCSNELYTTAIANFNKLERPLIWVPGDNDWTDCWGRYGASMVTFYDPLDRLALERALFTSTDQSLGEKTLTLTRESDEGGAYTLYSENVRWTYGPVVYLGLNVQGPAEIDRQRNEEIARKAANLHWL